jgi:hypothetical protein
MNAILKAIGYIIVELIKHYTGKLKRTTVTAEGNPERAARLRDRIRKRWDDRG